MSFDYTHQQLTVLTIHPKEVANNSEHVEKVGARQPPKAVRKSPIKMTESYMVNQHDPKMEIKRNIPPMNPRTPVRQQPSYFVAQGLKLRPASQDLKPKTNRQPSPANNQKRVSIEKAKLCPKKHHLHFSQDQEKFSCSRCSKPSKKNSWRCLTCRYNECISCTPYPRSKCPYNEVLQSTGSLNIELTYRACDICQDKMQANGVTCPGCNYDLCYKCLTKP